MKKKCIVCEVEFETKHKSQKYCSNECRGRARKEDRWHLPVNKENTCKICGNTFLGVRNDLKYCSKECYKKRRRKKFSSEEEINKRNTEQRKRNRKKQEYLWNIKKEKGCERCGFEDPRALIFHHLDPKEKDFNLSGGIISMKKINEELSKCIVLCANCHYIEHFRGEYNE